MIDKDTLLEAMLLECRICVHLHGKIPVEAADHRPTPGQRTLLELLRYLAFCGLGGTRRCLEGGWDGYREAAEGTAEMRFEEFPAAMRRQQEALKSAFESFDDEAFATRTAVDPIGTEQPLGKALLLVPLRWLIGYRMQLFLYAKSAGVADVGTRDCWYGTEAP